uniref:Uncharacterized protein n=1 Tax=Cairina moschata TaxID=8855 RepID=A0A8C3GJM8_CAIMO
CCSSRYQQGAFMHLLLILLCLQVSSAVLAQLYSIQMTSDLKSTMGHLFYQYNGVHSQAPGSSAVDVVQKRLQCCGVQNYTDWLKTASTSWHLLAENARVPESCCKEKYSVCRGELHQLEQLFQEGCLRKLEDHDRLVFLGIFICPTFLLKPIFAWLCGCISVLRVVRGSVPVWGLSSSCLCECCWCSGRCW